MLHFAVDTPESDLRLALVECGRILYDRGLVTSNDGNLSVRQDDSRVLITARGACKGRLSVDELLVVDLSGNVLEGLPGTYPSSETPMHLEVYKLRPDIRAVIHAHPRFATALTVAGMDFPADILPESIALLGEVPVTEYAAPSSEEDALAIRPLIGRHRAILLRQHGSLTCGADLEEALVHLERLEHVAEVFWRARALGRVERLTPEARQRLGNMGGSPSQE